MNKTGVVVVSALLLATICYVDAGLGKDKPVARIDFGEVRDSPKVGLLDEKSGLLETAKTSFLAQVDIVADFAWCAAPPPHPSPSWLRAG